MVPRHHHPGGATPARAEIALYVFTLPDSSASRIAKEISEETGAPENTGRSAAMLRFMSAEPGKICYIVAISMGRRNGYAPFGTRSQMMLR